MEINSTGSVPNFRAIQQSRTNQTQTTAKPSGGLQTPQDELEISDAARIMLQELHESPEQRAEKLAAIKQSITDGTYETEEKLDAALFKMMNDVLDQND